MYTKEEIKYTILQIRNSFVEEIEILSRVIKKVWPIYKKYIKNFFGIYLNKKHHLQYFKLTILYTLLKPSKQICSKLRLYNFIVLLLCFRKVLKRVIIRWLVIFIFKINLINNLYFEMIPGKSVIDTIITLMHNIKKAMK